MSVKYFKGDVLDAPQFLVAHQVNCKGVMGSGVAKAIRDRHPYVFKTYYEFVRFHKGERTAPSKALLGEVQYVFDSGKVFCNIFSQNEYMPRTECHTDYPAMKKAFQTIKNDYPSEDIAIPRIGCGLGGGDWNIVTQLLDEVFDDRTVYVYDLE